MTNAFEEINTKLPPGKVPTWDEYGFGASSCDQFNALMCKKYWPYRRQSWKHSIDDVVFTIVMLDIYNLYLSEASMPGTITILSAMKELAYSLLAHAQTL